MANKYFWNSKDLNDMIDDTGSGYARSASDTIFANFPGTKQINLASYETYTSDDEDDLSYNLPPFFDGGVSIFKNIKMNSILISGDNDNVTIPGWANAVKIYVVSKSGSSVGKIAQSGLTRDHRNRTNINHNRNNNENHHENNNKRHHNRNKNNDRNNFYNYNYNVNHDEVNNIDTVDYAAASGGTGFTYSTGKAFKLEDNYVITASFGSGSHSEAIIKQDTTIKGRIRMSIGTDAHQNPFTYTNTRDANGNEALLPTNANNTFHGRTLADGHGVHRNVATVGCESIGGNHNNYFVYNADHTDTTTIKKARPDGDHVRRLDGTVDTLHTYTRNENYGFGNFEVWCPEYNLNNRTDFTAGGSATAGTAASIFNDNSLQLVGFGNYSPSEDTNTGSTNAVRFYWFKV